MQCEHCERCEDLDRSSAMDQPIISPAQDIRSSPSCQGAPSETLNNSGLPCPPPPDPPRPVRRPAERRVVGWPAAVADGRHAPKRA